MKTRGLLLILIASLVLAIAPFQQAGLAQSSRSRVFSETGHVVSGPFLDKYDAAEKPELIYGYPVTGQFVDDRGIQVQYFQKARFELIVSAIGVSEVILTPVGRLLYDQEGTRQVLPLASQQGCSTFAPSEYPVCHSFLDFYVRYGGVAQFGYPISTFESYGNRIVQYFEYARLEWYPEYAGGEVVVVANLGVRYFDVAGEEPVKLQPSFYLDDGIADAIIQPTSISTIGFVGIPGSSNSAERPIYVIVRDQTREPVEGATVSILVRYQTGEPNNFIVGRTNEHGFISNQFQVDLTRPGITEVIIQATYNSLVARTSTSFRIWK